MEVSDALCALAICPNAIVIWLSSLAYVPMCAVRRIGLAGTKMENATCGTILLQEAVQLNAIGMEATHYGHTSYAGARTFRN